MGLFAILGFVYVPLGRHTGLEHLKAVFSTPAASAALAELTGAALGLRQRALAFVSARGPAPSTDEGNDPDAALDSHPRGQEPKPVPPKLK